MFPDLKWATFEAEDVPATLAPTPWFPDPAPSNHAAYSESEAERRTSKDAEAGAFPMATFPEEYEIPEPPETQGFPPFTESPPTCEESEESEDEREEICEDASDAAESRDESCESIETKFETILFHSAESICEPGEAVESLWRAE
jgi:hypothetical protein